MLCDKYLMLVKTNLFTHFFRVYTVLFLTHNGKYYLFFPGITNKCVNEYMFNIVGHLSLCNNSTEESDDFVP